MNQRKEFKTNVSEVLYAVKVGFFVRYLSWPFEFSYCLASQTTNTLSNFQILKHAFQPETLISINRIFFKSGMLQTLGKSFSNTYSIYYVSKNFDHLSAIEKGLTTAFFSAPGEIAVTSWGELTKVQRFFKAKARMQEKRTLSQFTRAMMITAPKVIWSSVITFTGIELTTAGLKQIFPNQAENPYLKSTAAILSSPVTAAAVMPFINAQTHVMMHPGQPLSKSLSTFVKTTTRKEAFYGTTLRGLRNAITYGLTFLCDPNKKDKISNNKKTALCTDDNPRLGPDTVITYTAGRRR